MQSVPYSNSPFMALAGADPHADAFLRAAGITDAGQVAAVQQLVSSLKEAGLFTPTKIQACYPLVGGTAQAHALNLLDPALYPVAFAAGIGHSAGGVQATSASPRQLALTGYTCSQHQATDTLHLGLYTRTAGTDTWDMGAVGGGAQVAALILSRAALTAADIGDDNSLTNGPTQTTATGFFVGSRTSTTSLVLYKNGAAIGSNNAATPSPMSKTTTPLAFCGASSSFPLDGSTKQVAFASIGPGLSAAEVASYNTIVQAFQTALGRQV